MSPRWKRRVHGSVGSSHHDRKPGEQRTALDAERLDRALEEHRRAGDRVVGRTRATRSSWATAPVAAGREDRRRVGERPPSVTPADDDLGLEHAERGGDHARAHLADQRAATREVRRTVGQVHQAELTGTRREAELRRTRRDTRARRTPARSPVRAPPPACGSGGGRRRPSPQSVRRVSRACRPATVLDDCPMTDDFVLARRNRPGRSRRSRRRFAGRARRRGHRPHRSVAIRHSTR